MPIQRKSHHSFHRDSQRIASLKKRRRRWLRVKQSFCSSSHLCVSVILWLVFSSFLRLQPAEAAELRLPLPDSSAKPLRPEPHSPDIDTMSFRSDGSRCAQLASGGMGEPDSKGDRRWSTNTIECQVKIEDWAPCCSNRIRGWGILLPSGRFFRIGRWQARLRWFAA